MPRSPRGCTTPLPAGLSRTGLSALGMRAVFGALAAAALVWLVCFSLGLLRFANLGEEQLRSSPPDAEAPHL